MCEVLSIVSMMQEKKTIVSVNSQQIPPDCRLGVWRFARLDDYEA